MKNNKVIRFIVCLIIGIGIGILVDYLKSVNKKEYCPPYLEVQYKWESALTPSTCRYNMWLKGYQDTKSVTVLGSCDLHNKGDILLIQN